MEQPLPRLRTLRPRGISLRTLNIRNNQGIWARAGHPGSTDWWLQPDDTYGDQYYRPVLLVQQSGIRRGVSADEKNGGGSRAGGSAPSHPGPNPGLEHRGYKLPRAELGEMQVHHQRTM